MNTENETPQVDVENAEESNESPATQMARNVMLAGLGVAVVVRENFGPTLDRLIEKGTKAEKENRKRLNKLVEQRRKDMTKAEEKIEDMVDERIEAVLKTMNIPSKADIDNLTTKITALTKKVGELDAKVAAERKAA